MKSIFKISLLCVLLSVIYSCKKYETDFRNFLGDNELIYTGAVTDVQNLSGNLKVGLKWKASTDPTITKYVIFWNNKLDSQVVNIDAKKDTISTVINGLQEYVYSFTIYSFDAKGNKSIPKEVNNVKVYGPIYQSGLQNRAFNTVTPYLSYTDALVKLNFITPDTININTEFKYENQAGVVVEKLLKPNDLTIELPGYKLGTPIRYRSTYIPQKNSLDVFTVSDYSVFPEYVFKDVECDKSLFKEVSLPNDVQTLDESPVRKLWDGSVGAQAYPNIYHSKDNISIPHTLTFDMGKIYNNLTKVEETGRNCCHNPTEFEVWGIADLTNAATTLPASDAGWKAESISKGWVLLKDVTRTDNGQDPMKFDLLDTPTPVRYIRIRVKKTDNNETRQSNMSEITFWNFQ